tara:strand:- start:3913 stop:4341 length:429 start_codon:yes stop_codon:yes gene_type:complete
MQFSQKMGWNYGEGALEIFLKRAKFKFIGEGTYKRCFTSKKYPGVVVKIPQNFYILEKNDRFKGGLPKEYKRFEMREYFNCKRWIIQALVNHKRKKGFTKCSAAEALGGLIEGSYSHDDEPYDLHDENVLWHNKMPRIVDWL